MAHRTILTERQRSVLFDLPIDETAMLRHYILADDDLEIIRARRRPHNRFGFALQLCALRYPGRLLTPGEVIPMEITRFLAAQLGLKSDDLAGYAAAKKRVMNTWRPCGISMATRCSLAEGRAT